MEDSTIKLMIESVDKDSQHRDALLKVDLDHAIEENDSFHADSSAKVMKLFKITDGHEERLDGLEGKEVVQKAAVFDKGKAWLIGIGAGGLAGFAIGKIIEYLGGR
jgi:hypothetical protein